MLRASIHEYLNIVHFLRILVVYVNSVTQMIANIVALHEQLDVSLSTCRLAQHMGMV